MSKSSRVFSVVIDADLCKGCGYCEEGCAKGVYSAGTEMNSQGYAFMLAPHSDKCVGCLTCVMCCPDFAIAVDERAAP